MSGKQRKRAEDFAWSKGFRPMAFRCPQSGEQYVCSLATDILTRSKNTTDPEEVANKVTWRVIVERWTRGGSEVRR